MGTLKGETVGILGCGWLGKALAEKLINEGVDVKGTTTSADKLKALKAIGITAYQIQLLKENTIGPLEKFLENVETLVISIPPGYKNSDDALYHALKRLFAEQDLQNIQKLIYISSTGVFEDGEGCVYDEDSSPNARSAKGQYLIQLESLFKPEHFKQEVTVLRYGGLIKYDGRHPIHYLAGKKNVANPDAPVNLIEQNDAVELLYALLNAEKLQPVFHGVYPWHPSRKEYYTQKAKELGLEPPEFKSNTKSLGKEISSEKTSRGLNFSFKRKV